MSFTHLLGKGCVCVHIKLDADVKCPPCFLTRGLSVILESPFQLNRLAKDYPPLPQACVTEGCYYTQFLYGNRGSKQRFLCLPVQCFTQGATSLDPQYSVFIFNAVMFIFVLYYQSWEREAGVARRNPKRIIFTFPVVMIKYPTDSV